MKQVTIRQCPVCQNIRGLTNDVAAILKSDRDLTVKIMDGGKGEFTVEMDGRKVSELSAEMLPSPNEVVSAVRDSAAIDAKA